jgi:hypothetical protein
MLWMAVQNRRENGTPAKSYARRIFWLHRMVNKELITGCFSPAGVFLCIRAQEFSRQEW